MWTAFDEHCMQRALHIAEHGVGALGLYSEQPKALIPLPRPNPYVGCVLVQDQQIVAEGAHLRAGTAHAERHAIAAARHRGIELTRCTAVVTLEPCAHSGRTPPCVAALLEAGIPKVIAAMQDPFPEVAGRGFAALRAHGVDVKVGLMEAQARAINAGFLSRIERQQPYLHLKLASSLDGRTALADGSSFWITGESSRLDVHRQRMRAGAILSAIGTVLADDPYLNVRLCEAESQPYAPAPPPMKVICDSTLRTPKKAKLRGGAPLLFAHALPAGSAMPDAEFCWRDIAARDRLPALLKHLALAYQINEVWVEAGARLAGALLGAELVDQLWLYQAPTLLGVQAKPLADLDSPLTLDAANRWQLLDCQRFDQDVRMRLLRDARARAPVS